MSRPALDRSRAAVINAAVGILVDEPAASMVELAQRLGLGRTTLYRMFPTRELLVRAVAEDAIAHLAAVQSAAGIHDMFTDRMDAAASTRALENLVGDLIPLGPRITFLLRAPELVGDADISSLVAELDVDVIAAIVRGQRAGYFSADLRASWALECLNAIIYAAWEAVAAGRIAANDAPRLVIDTWSSGVSSR